MPQKGLLLSFVFLLFCLSAKAQSNPGFENRPDIPHCMLIILNEDWAEPGEISASVVKYNLNTRRNDRLKVSLLRMPYLSNLPVIYVREFRNEAHLLEYYKDLTNEKPDFMQMNIVDLLVPLSNANYNQVLIQKSLIGYQQFFDKYYAGKLK